MSKTETGGPAFPTQEQRFPDGVLNQEAEYGMTLRDYFAAKAMLAAATNLKGADGFRFDERAQWAYLQADAMLEARK